MHRPPSWMIRESLAALLIGALAFLFVTPPTIPASYAGPRNPSGHR
jgi:hypothetical protein